MAKAQDLKLHVFISHKHEYEQAAIGLKRVLGLFGGSNIEVYISEEIPAGTDWFDWIRSRLAQSNLLLLLFTEETSSWDWPLYEAGLFTRLEGEDLRRVICIHHPHLDPPKPLKHLQAVPATPDKMATFLGNLFGGSSITGLPEPLNKELARNESVLDKHSRAICSHFVPRSVLKRHYDRYIDLYVKNPEDIEESKIPAEAVVEADRRSLEIFGLAEGQHCWRDIERKMEQAGDGNWVSEFTRSVWQAKDGDIPEPVFSAFHTKRGAFFRPELFRSDEISDGSMIFHVLFIEELEGPLSNMPDDIKALATSLKFAFRFRWEVLEPFGRDDLTEEDIDALDESMTRIEADAASYGLLDPELVVKQFQGEDAACIEQMYEDWGRLRNAERNGELDQALADKDPSRIETLLREIVPINREFVDMVARQFAHAMSVGAN